MQARRVSVVVTLVAMTACSGQPPSSSSATDTPVTTLGDATSPTTGADDTSAPSTSTTTGADSTSADATSSDSDEDSPVKFDLVYGDVDLHPTTGCNKIDFVFSVDNSCSTEDDQLTLQQAFGDFLQLIYDNVQGQDYHIIVVDSDGDPSWACGSGFGTCCPDFTPGSHVFTTCDLEMGAGVVAPYGGNASNQDCGIPDGRRYLEGDDMPLEDMFACVAQVGTSGNFAEFPVTAAVLALENPLGCNDGFLRDDAILVMTVITDDHDGDFSYPGDAENGDPNDWYQRIVDAKNGNEEATVFIGLTSNHCSAPPVPPIAGIVPLFGDRGIQGSHCTLAEMHDSFEAAVTAIDTTCDDFIPG